MMPPAHTYFDTAGRQAPEALTDQIRRAAEQPLMAPLLDGLAVPAFLLNAERQIVLANKASYTLAASLGVAQLDGLRLGEALACINVPDGPDGCGTAHRCRYCGTGQANKAFSHRPGPMDAEVRLRSVRGDAERSYTFRAHLAPVGEAGAVLRLCTLVDVTDERNRETQDHIFFHDVLNTAQAVHGAAGLITAEDDPDSLTALARVVTQGSTALIGEIEAQRDLRRAEEGTAAVALQPASVWQTVADTAELYRRSRFAKGVSIEVADNPGQDVVPISPVHLARVVGNLIKNALEASAPGDVVRTAVTSDARGVAVTVNNRAVMPDAVQAQVFQRFFSTKAASGRGLGTYSVRLLVTRVLQGTVDFESRAGAGTTFTVRLPRS